MWRSVFFVGLLACGGAPHPDPVMSGGLDDPGAFVRLAEDLVGAWRTESGIRVTYALVSNGSALLETWTGPSGSQTLTVYHPDHDTVRLTHYCAQGNQARLHLTSAEPRRFLFDREAVTNLLPGQGVLTVLELRTDAGLDRIETYVDEAGVAEVSEIHFERVPD